MTMIPQGWSRGVLAMALGLTAPGAMAGDMPVMAFDQAVSWWQAPRPLPVPAAPADAAPGCVQLAFRIARDGRTQDPAVLGWWSASGDARARHADRDRFARLAAAALATWRFTPLRKDAPALVTAYTFAFDAGGNAADVRARCDVGDVVVAIARAQRRLGDRGGLWQGRMDRKQVSDPATIGRDRHGWFDGQMDE